VTEAKRISAKDARSRITSGQALLVCAYEDEEKFRKMHLQGAISLREFTSRLPVLSREQEIVFY